MAANINQEFLRPIMSWVDTEQEARNSYVVPGTIGFYMEKNNPRFHIKDGINSFRSFEFKEITPPPQTEATTQYVTEEKFYAAIDDLKSYISDMNRKQYRNNKENNNAKPTV